MKQKDPPQNPVSDADVDKFSHYVAKWQQLLNLRNWRITKAKKREQRNMAALVSVEHEHKLARYAVGVDFGSTPVTPESLESTALHELLHLLLRPMLDVAMSEGEHNNTLLEEEHSVIIVLEELLMHAYRDKDE